MASCRWVLDEATCVSLGRGQQLSNIKNLAVKDGRFRAAARSEGLVSLSEGVRRKRKPSRAVARVERRLPPVFLLEGVL